MTVRETDLDIEFIEDSQYVLYKYRDLAHIEPAPTETGMSPTTVGIIGGVIAGVVVIAGAIGFNIWWRNRTGSGVQLS